MNTIDEELTINAVRVLSAEMVEKANSGHPGLPLGAAAIGYTLFAKHLKHVPKSPNFVNRDRFVLSAGHGSALLYSLLHIFGYPLVKEDLMNFRQLRSKTPGHPEYGVTAGVEVSTGPLGQGIANAVGFALAEKLLAEKFNKEGVNLVDHYTYALCGDGCMMEGIEAEAASIAGTLKLGKLIVLYDSNRITIEGSTDLAFTEDIATRHESQGWHVIRVNNGNDVEEISAAITLAKAEKTKPSLIVVNTVIGFGSPLAGTNKCHGAPLGAENLDALKKELKWKAKPFELPADVTRHIEELTPALNKYEADYNRIVKEYKSKFPEDYAEYQKWLKGNVDLSEVEFKEVGKKDEATRNSSCTVLNKIAAKNPFIIGGSADLGPSNLTVIKDGGDVSANKFGRNIHFGIREHAMAAMCNGMYLHGGVMPYCSTFLVFSDYMRNAIRMSALMNIPVTYVFTHDSIGVGEDGPTHQPIEHVTSLRSIPNLNVFRPCDGKETVAAYEDAFTGKNPTAIICSRQTLPQIKGSSRENALFGGYVISPAENEVPDAILIASGSEVSLAIDTQAALKQDGVDVSVVSMPCQELFDVQTAKYRESVLPSEVTARIAVEAGLDMSWYKYVGLDGAVVGINDFGKSAPANVLFELYGLDVDNVSKTVKKVLRQIKKNNAAKQ